MSGEDFYITLPSNSSISYYPDNTLANFRTKLPQPIHLDVSYEVALTEIHFPVTWGSFQGEDSVISERFKDRRGISHQTYIVIPSGKYPSVGVLTAAINNFLKKNKDGGEEAARSHIFTYDAITNRVTVYGTRRSEIMFKGRLARMLGFKDGVYTRLSELTHAPLAADLHGGLNTMFVYSDIIEHQYVGDYREQLLRAVHIDDASKDTVTTIYDRPHYLRLSRNRIDSIHIAIKTYENKPIDFESGQVIAVLHFRPVKYN